MPSRATPSGNAPSSLAQLLHPLTGSRRVTQDVVMSEWAPVLFTAGGAVIGALGAACFSYFASRRQPRDQGKVEHAQVLRGERREAYLAFLECYQRLDRKLEHLYPLLGSFGVGDAPEPDWGITRRVFGEASDLMDELQKIALQITLCGPQHIALLVGRLQVEARFIQVIAERVCADQGGTPELHQHLSDKVVALGWLESELLVEVRDVLETPV